MGNHYPQEIHDYSDLYGKATRALGNAGLVRMALTQQTPSSVRSVAKVMKLPWEDYYSTHALSRIKRDHPWSILEIPEVKKEFKKLPKPLREDILRQIERNKDIRMAIDIVAARERKSK